MNNTDEVQLSDMLVSYPPAETPGIQTIISSKREFSELASDIDERLAPGRGQFFKHQRLTLRYLRAYDRLMLISEPGTGKSCQVLAFIEYSRRELEKAKVNPIDADEKAGHFRKVVILVKGGTHKSEIRNQIFCKCSDGRYETDNVKRQRQSTAQKKEITRELGKVGYVIKTYKSFTNSILKEFKTDQEIADAYSDTIFWIDEGHNLNVLSPDETTTLRDKQQTYQLIWKVLHLAQRSKIIVSTATPMINDIIELGPLMNLILPLDHHIPRGYNWQNAPANDIRVLFPGFTGDPKNASFEEMSQYFRGQFPDNYNFQGANIEDLEPFFRGRIGYIRAADTGAVPEEQTNPEVNIDTSFQYTKDGVSYRSEMNLYNTVMSDFQTQNFLRSFKDDDSLMQQARQASNFIFPDGNWGNGTTEAERSQIKQMRQIRQAAKEAVAAPSATKATVVESGAVNFGINPAVDELEFAETQGFDKHAFRKYVIMDGDNFSATPEFAAYLSNYENIRQSSSKYAEVLRLVHYDVGNVFIYGEFIVGSGAIVMALCFEAIGYKRFDESTSIFVNIVGGDDAKPVCAGSDSTMSSRRRLRPDFIPHSQGGPMRYALLHQMSDAKFSTMMEAMNSYENRHGDLIRVLISSRVGREGINVNNVRQIHIIGAEWNPSAIYQALSRGIRATSHEDLLREEQERIRLAGGDPSKAKILVKVFKHVALANNPEHTSSDLRMYQTTENKDRVIHRILRIMKQCAIDCQIHYNRNVRATDVDGSPRCDYDVCRYKCYDPVPSEEDFSTYDILYSDDIVEAAEDRIINIFHQSNSVSLEFILSQLTDFRRKYVIMALERLIFNKVTITDRFGYTTYLREDRSMFYLDRTYPLGLPPMIAMSYYTNGLIAIERKNLVDYVASLESNETIDVINQLLELNPNTPGYDQIINMHLSNMNVEGEVAVFESAVLRTLRGETNPLLARIIDTFKTYYFNIAEPVNDLTIAYAQANSQLPKRGRKPNPETKHRLQKLTGAQADIINQSLQSVEGQEKNIILHTIYTREVGNTRYNIRAKQLKGEGRTRILNVNDLNEGWTDVNPIENTVYNTLIQALNQQSARKMSESGNYGIIENDNLWIVNVSAEDFEKSSRDTRNKYPGKLCKSYNVAGILDFMYYFKVPIPQELKPIEQSVNRMTEDQVVSSMVTAGGKIFNPEILSKYPLEEKKYMAVWRRTGMKKDDLCQRLKDHLVSSGRVQYR